jgi:transposase
VEVPDLTGFTFRQLQEIAFRQQLEKRGSLPEAAKALGVSLKTAYTWKKRIETPEPLTTGETTAWWEPLDNWSLPVAQ